MTKLLAASFFPAFFPCMSGGELRLYNFYNELGKHYEVSLISLTNPGRYERVRHPNFIEHRVPKPPLYLKIYAELDAQGVRGERAGLAAALMGRHKTDYHNLFDTLAKDVDAIIHDFPYTLPFDRGFASDGKPRIYNSHNFESGMFRSLLENYHSEYADYISNLEQVLAKGSRAVFATNANEAAIFELFYGIPSENIFVVPNGFDPEGIEQSATEQGGPLIFFGSGHPPNIEAARQIIDCIAPALPKLNFEIAGGVCDNLARTPTNVRLIGKLDEAGKRDFLARASVFINPMMGGAGTSLKLIEAMAAGLAILSTPIGARGLGLVDGETALIKHLGEFPLHAEILLENPTLRKRLGSAASAHAHATFRWEEIGKAAAKQIVKIISRRSPPSNQPSTLPKSILILNDYSIDSAVSGGSKRLSELLRAASKTSPYILLCLGRQKDVTISTLSENLLQVCIPKASDQLGFEDYINSKNPSISVNDIASAVFCQSNGVLCDWFQRLAGRAKLILLSHPYLTPLLLTSRPLPPVVYEAHNVEAQIKADLLKQHSHGPSLSKFTESTEQLACSMATEVITTTESDAEELARRYGHGCPTTIVRNGGEVLSPDELAESVRRRVRRLETGSAKIVFLGSAHPPNVEGVAWFVAEILPTLSAELWLVGGICDADASWRSHAQIRCHGTVSDEEKVRILSEADLAINPLFSGGGSSLKIADYLGCGVPIVSTAVGCRGFTLENGKHLVIAGPEEFGSAITALVKDTERLTFLSRAGHAFAERHTGWEKLRRDFGDTLSRLGVTERETGKTPRILVVTYRYTEPPRGGAEEYLLRLLGEYSRFAGAHIDLVAANVGDLGNKYKFATEIGAPPEATAALAAPFARSIEMYTVDQTNDAALLSDARDVLAAWVGEDVSLGRSLASELTETCFLGGFYEVERSGQESWVWTGAKAEILLDESVAAVKVFGETGRGPEAISVAINGRAEVTIEAPASFCLEIQVNKGQRNIVTISTPNPFCAPEDGRLLGVRILDIQLLQSHLWTRLPLDRTYAAIVKRQRPWDWIDHLRRVAASRSPEVEAAFTRLRGPHCTTLISQLTDSIEQYDLAIVQGIQFGVSQKAVEILKAKGLPVVLLPHYHADDRFYHWNTFYRTLQEADAVLSFSPSVSSRFLTPLGANTFEIAGGGVSLSEYTSPRKTLGAFRQLWRDRRPFILVLGRKTGSKDYGAAIEAHQKLLRDGHDLNLLLIGPDEDKIPIEGDRVFYLGPQPRDVVIGALQSCACLITMSTSESFGIVIVEAWMCGKPVVARRSCLAFSELVTDGEDGFLVDTSAEAAQALTRLITNPALATRMGEVGQTKAQEQYSWQAIARRFQRILETVWQARPRIGEAPPPRTTELGSALDESPFYTATREIG